MSAKEFPLFQKLHATLTVYMKYAKAQHEIVQDNMLNERAKVERLKALAFKFKKALQDLEEKFLTQFQFNPDDPNDCSTKEQHEACGLEFDFYKN